MADLYTLFENLKPAQAQQAAEQFQETFLQPGATVVTEGEPTDSMLFIEAGEVAVFAGGHEVAHMAEGAIIGEIGLFAHAKRTATVKAVTGVTLQVLTRDRFLRLRDAGNPVAFRIERRALVQLTGRFRQLVGDMQRVGAAAPQLLVDVPMGQVGAEDVAVHAAGRAQALQMASGFRDVHPQVIAQLVPAFTSVACRQGPMVWADQPTGSLLLIVEGSVAAYAPLHNQGVQVAAIGPGELVDVAPHIDQQPRSTHFACTEDCLLLELEPRLCQQALYRDDLLGSALRIAMIRALASRVNQLNAVYAQARLLAPAEMDHTLTEEEEPTPYNPPTPLPLARR